MLGEYLWIGNDAHPGQSEQTIVIASSYSTLSTRYINLYKIVDN